MNKSFSLLYALHVLVTGVWEQIQAASGIPVLRSPSQNQSMLCPPVLCIGTREFHPPSPRLRPACYISWCSAE
jgi:hypothetical protein